LHHTNKIERVARQVANIECIKMNGKLVSSETTFTLITRIN